jgi:hypothetical protein
MAALISPSELVRASLAKPPRAASAGTVEIGGDLINHEFGIS